MSKFKIDFFIRYAGTISVEIIGDDYTNEAYINVDKYMAWLYDTGKLNWVLDEVDHEGNHVQKTGTYNEEQYFNLYQWQITKDLTEYIELFIIK